MAFRRRWPAVREECTAKHQAKHIVVPAVVHKGSWHVLLRPNCFPLMLEQAAQRVGKDIHAAPGWSHELLESSKCCCRGVVKFQTSLPPSGFPYALHSYSPLCWYIHVHPSLVWTIWTHGRSVANTAGGGIGRRKARAACSATWRSTIFAMGGPRWFQHVKALGCISIVNDENT